ncbi:hypothetical protein ABZV31_33590 [Streptomyces sp. NPDC005202]|uniref:hypothetical protein n=1 Tax=Streptomyces sp. NPDC005202 TaxID=3157021 RepID=UPI00339F24B5
MIRRCPPARHGSTLSKHLNVGLARLRTARGQFQQIVEESESILALAYEFGEDHNRAHILLEVGRAHQ